MRVLSLNAWGGAMFDDLAAWLPTTGADVVCLQEVTRSPVRGWTAFEDAERSLPQRGDLFDDVAALLPGHTGTFTAFDAGPVHDSTGRRHRQEFGLATFVRRGIDVLDRRDAFVHGAYTEHEGGWPAGDRPRAALAVRLGTADGRRLLVVQAHGVRDPAGKHDTPARRAQAHRLAALVGAVRQPGDLVVVAGDLNLLPGSETFAVLADAGLVDLVGTADTRTARYTKPLRHADYLLVSDPAAVQRFEIVAAPEVSDHRPLVLDI